jgi:3-phenylpropionate/trans-cinnamate dioxygenase ferredoxin subunit
MKSETKAKSPKAKPPKPSPKRTDGYVAVATTAEIPAGAHKIVDAGEQSIVIFNADGEYYALINECSHDNGPLGEGLVYDHEIMCPRHGARFDFRTGKVLSFPAVADVSAYSVKVEGDKILVKLHDR